MQLKHLLLSAFIGITTMASAQQKTVNVTTPGTLSTLITAPYDAYSDLKLTGTINRNDIVFIDTLMANVQKLDLKDVTIAECTDAKGTTYPANEFPSNSFTTDTVLTTVILPSSITSIGSYAVNYEDKNIGTKNSLTTVDFSNCKNLENIKDHAFDYAFQINKIDLSNLTALKRIGAYAFDQTAAEEIILDGCSALERIEERGIYQSYEVKKISLKGCTSLKFIGNRAFLNLAKNSGKDKDFSMVVDLSETAIDTIDESAFQSAKMTEVILPSTLKNVNSKAFNLTTKLSKITFLGTTPPQFGTSAIYSSALRKATINVPQGSEAAYKTALGLADDATNVIGIDPTGIESITTSASDIKVAAGNGTITINGLANGERISVYSSNGVEVYSGYAATDSLTISVAHGIYLIVVDGKLQAKVAA